MPVYRDRVTCGTGTGTAVPVDSPGTGTRVVGTGGPGSGTGYSCITDTRVPVRGRAASWTTRLAWSGALDVTREIIFFISYLRFASCEL